jgi:PAS domain-containing protein
MISRHALGATWLYVAVRHGAAGLGARRAGRALVLRHDPPGRPARRAEALARLNADVAPHTGRYRMAHSDGRWIWVETLARQVHAADGTAEREAQERFRLAFDDAPIGMALVDLRSRVTRVNTALCDLLERAEEDLLGRTIHELTAPEDLAVDLEHLHRLTAGEIPCRRRSSTWPTTTCSAGCGTGAASRSSCAARSPASVATARRPR